MLPTSLMTPCTNVHEASDWSTKAPGWPLRLHRHWPLMVVASGGSWLLAAKVSFQTATDWIPFPPASSPFTPQTSWPSSFQTLSSCAAGLQTIRAISYQLITFTSDHQHVFLPPKLLYEFCQTPGCPPEILRGFLQRHGQPLELYASLGQPTCCQLELVWVVLFLGFFDFCLLSALIGMMKLGCLGFWICFCICLFFISEHYRVCSSFLVYLYWNDCC